MYILWDKYIGVVQNYKEMCYKFKINEVKLKEKHSPGIARININFSCILSSIKNKILSSDY